MSEEKKKKNLATYAVCMILAVIILILFAAMADNREEQFENQIHEKEQLNMNIQNQIVSLSDENYTLKKEAEEIRSELEQKNAELSFFQSLSHAWGLYSTGDIAGAQAKLDEIKAGALNETQTAAMQALTDALATKE